MVMSMIRRGICALLLVCSGHSLAVAADASASAEVKENFARMLKANDLWSAMQVQAYGRTMGVDLRMPQVWAGVEVIGDPLFACPDEILALVDLGSTVLAATRRSIYRFAPAGYPLAPSIAYGFVADRCAISPDGSCVAAIRIDNNGGEGRPWSWRARLIMLATGKSTDFTGAARMDSSIEWKTAVSCDGSSVAFSLHEPPEVSILYIVSAQGARETSRICNPVAVGPKGSWAIADRQGSSKQVLVRGDDVTAISLAAIGPDIVAVMTGDGGSILVGRDGAKMPTPTWPARFGRDASFQTVGTWLELCTGRSPPEGGSNSPGWGPDTTALYHWDELGNGVDGPPVRSFSGGTALIEDRRAAIGRWQGKELIMVDLDADEAKETAIATFEQPIAWARWGTHGGFVALESGRKVVFDTLGRTVASGDGEITLLHRQIAVIQRGKTFESVHLDEDPLLRSRTPLELSGEWYFTMDPHREGLFAYRGNEYVEFATDGHALRRGSREDGVAPYISWSPGRWYIRCGRIFPKSMSECSIQSRLHPSDAWVAGRSMVILGRDARITVSGRKHGEFTELPQVALGDHFARVAGKDDLLCVDGANRAHAVLTLAQNPTVSNIRGDPGDDLPPGPWQVAQLKFSIPRGPACEWDAAKAGFVPDRLRSPKDSPDLIAVTASLVLMLDPVAAKVFARK